jgi:hypothetical protein
MFRQATAERLGQVRGTGRAGTTGLSDAPLRSPRTKAWTKARTAGAAATFLIWGGVVYAVLWIYGLLIGHDRAANVVPVDTADNCLHLGLAIVMVALGCCWGVRSAPRSRQV